MKKTFILSFVLLALLTSASAAPVIVFNGDTLQLTDEFKRKQCGTLKTSILIPEVSGIACSRVTPGYLWMQSDEIEKENQIVATTTKGDVCQVTLNLKLKHTRWDWEDLCGGVYEGKNYLFVGAFGDNDETDGEYYIHYFEEPEIPSEPGSVKTIQASSISYQYPDGKKHNAEALMYDNISQTLYVITKVYYDVPVVYSLPMRLDYGTEMQTLTQVCTLGVKSDLGEGAKPDRGFHLVTGADISPDGSRILIKNHNNTKTGMTATLIWEREGNEDIAETLKRQPLEISAYRLEWQGEAICWLDNYMFFTTSDSEGDPPVYRYTSEYSTAVEDIEAPASPNKQMTLHNGTLYIQKEGKTYTLTGEEVTL